MPRKKRDPEGPGIKRDKNGRWAKGTVGNPGGRPKEAEGLREVCRRYGYRAAEMLWDIACDKAQPGSVRVAACKEILDRGFGKAPQTVTINWETISDSQLDSLVRDIVRLEDGKEATIQ